MDYIPAIGLEIHAELSTGSKVFCSCPVEFGGEPNTRICPVCTGQPGTLPVLNRKAVEYTVLAGLAMNCRINRRSRLDRKNYFYPDLPKAYQISQYDLPFCSDGTVVIETSAGQKAIGVERIHLEEDAGKLLHDVVDKCSLADYNRCGVPLIEIVSRPDMSSAEEARAYFEKVRLLLLYAGVSDCRMEEGSFRADVNVSVRPRGSDRLGTRTEMKNINSVRAVFRSIESEIRRQIEILSSGGRVVQETRKWDDNRGESRPLRSKEDSHDYRYFPEPDIVPVIIEPEEVERLRASLPRLPDERLAQYTGEYGIAPADAKLIVSDRFLADMFEVAASLCGNPRLAASLIVGEINRRLTDMALEPRDLPFSGEDLGKLALMQSSGRITANNAKRVLAIMCETGADPEDIAREQGFVVIGDSSIIEDTVRDVLARNDKAVGEYLEGKEKAFGFLMGQCSRALSGNADPRALRQALEKALSQMKGDRNHEER